MMDTLTPLGKRCVFNFDFIGHYIFLLSTFPFPNSNLSFLNVFVLKTFFPLIYFFQVFRQLFCLTKYGRDKSGNVKKSLENNFHAQGVVDDPITNCNQQLAVVAAKLKLKRAALRVPSVSR